MTNASELHPRTVRYAERALARDVIEKILVIVDPAATVQPCIPKAARLAARFGSTLELFCCDEDREIPQNWAGGTTLAQYRALVRERRLVMLETLAAPLRARGIHVRTESAWHVPVAEGISVHAIRMQADLVVKDAHGHNLEARLPAVQTDWALIGELPMPLLLVRSTPWDAHPSVAVSVDPCHVAERPVSLDESLMDLGCSIGRALTGDVEVLHALQAPPHLPGEHVSAEAMRHAHEQQRAAVSRVTDRSHIPDTALKFVERGIPEGIIELVTQARPAVLIMGVAARQRPHGPAESTAAQVLEQTDCDLLVVKPAGFVSPALVTDA